MSPTPKQTRAHPPVEPPESPLLAAFREVLPDAPRTLGPALAAFVAEAHRECPEPSIEDIDLIRHAAERLRAQASLPEALQSLRAGELRLCAAATRGDNAAVRLLLEWLARSVRALAGAQEGLADEVLQQARVKLLVEGKIADYRGRGALAGWLRAVVARLLHDARGVQAAPALLAQRLESEVVPDPELEYIKARYRPAFQRALAAELQALPRKTRVLLRLHHVEGLSIDKLAPVYHVSRATIARWLAQHRAELVDATRARLLRELQVSREELESLIRLVASRLHLTLSRVLAGDP